MPSLQVRLNRACRLLHIGKIGLAALIQRCGHANHHSIHLRQTREVAGGREVLGTHVLLNLGAWYVTDIALAFVELAHFVGIRVEPLDAVAGLCKSQAQRQSYVAASDYPY